jgi:hypothetical protein
LVGTLDHLHPHLASNLRGRVGTIMRHYEYSGETGLRLDQSVEGASKTYFFVVSWDNNDGRLTSWRLTSALPQRSNANSHLCSEASGEHDERSEHKRDENSHCSRLTNIMTNCDWIGVTVFVPQRDGQLAAN